MGIVLSALALWLLAMHPEITNANDQDIELNAVLMESTFKIQGESGGDLGTAFILGRPFQEGSPRARFVLVTAAHVLNKIRDEMAILMMRETTGPDQWQRLPWKIRIRESGEQRRPLWTRHPQVDVAVMYVRLPDNASLRTGKNFLPMRLLADDKVLSELNIHPGDELSCLGFPFGAESPAGFPILRSGKIASYPLLPSKVTRTFLFDFRIFPGNSGGPVYLVQSGRGITRGTSIEFRNVKLIVGLVTEQVRLEEQTIGGMVYHPLGLAHVVHASLIREAIELLPSPETVP